MEVIVKDNYDAVSALAAHMIADVVRRKPSCVLGLATGGTPLGTYKELIRLHHEDDVDFSLVTTFNLDEYVIRYENTHVPNGLADDLVFECQTYEDMINFQQLHYFVRCNNERLWFQ